MSFVKYLCKYPACDILALKVEERSMTGLYWYMIGCTENNRIEFKGEKGETLF